jgi:hypothetical protein
VLLLSSASSTAAAAAGDPSTQAIEVANLQQEVREMKQLLSMVLGAEPVEQMLGEGLVSKLNIRRSAQCFDPSTPVHA